MTEQETTIKEELADNVVEETTDEVISIQLSKLQMQSIKHKLVNFSNFIPFQSKFY